MNNKILKLEALRGFAAIYVALGHIFSRPIRVGSFDLSVFLRFGQEAVILFFVLSGFVIYYSFAKSSNKSFGLFFAKRFLRIYIPLFFAFALNVLFLWYQLGALPPIDGWELLGNLLMLQDLDHLKPGAITGPFLDNSPLWSLSYEWWFYMLFFVLITRFTPRARMLAYLISIVAALTYLVYPFFLNRFIMYFAIWWAGADIAELYLEKRAINFRNLRIPLAAIAACSAILVLNAWIQMDTKPLGMKATGSSPYLEVRHFIFALVALTAALLWKKAKWLGWKFTIAPFGRFANISFGIYILHWFMIAGASYLSFIGNRYIEMPLYFIICFATAYLIERRIYPPLNAWIVNKLKSRNRQREYAKD